jgi:hypothetical protein
MLTEQNPKQNGWIAAPRHSGPREQPHEPALAVIAAVVFVVLFKILGFY